MKRDWQLDWWNATSPDALDWPKPGTEKEWFEKWLQQRAVLQYWLKLVRELEEALMAMFGTTDAKRARSDLGGILRRLEETEKYADELESKLQRVRKLERVAKAAKDALSLLRCEKEFSEDLCIKVGNVVRHERVVQKLEQALAALEGGPGDE